MLELEQAVEKILAAVPPPTSESCALADVAGRVLQESLVSGIAIPPFDNSAMDGYAVRSADVQKANSETPVRLQAIGRAAAGEVFPGSLSAGQCVRVFTGSPLPDGADAVVMQEDTRTIDNSAEIQVLDSAKPWENVRLQGEDIKAGAALVSAGQTITAGLLGLLAATGIERVQVSRRPVVGLLATGSELRESGQPLTPGQIYESNRLSIAALCRSAGAAPQVYPLVPDSLEQTRAALETAFAQSDAVITSGGVSVGEMDFVKQAFQDLGGTLEFWRVAIKPGRPFVFGRFGQKLLFGLPGNPVSAFVTFLVLVRPALRRWLGAAQTGLPTIAGMLAEPLSNDSPRRHFIRVKLDDQGKVSSAGVQGSHMLSSLGRANGLVDVPPNTVLAAGSTVAVMPWE